MLTTLTGQPLPCINTHPQPTADQIRQAELLEREAENHLASGQDLDADGAGARIINGVLAADCQARAQLLRSAGYAEFYGLRGPDGMLLDAEIVSTKYGIRWRIRRDGAVEWAPVFPGRAATHAKRGIEEVCVWLPADLVEGPTDGFGRSTLRAVPRVDEGLALE